MAGVNNASRGTVPQTRFVQAKAYTHYR